MGRTGTARPGTDSPDAAFDALRPLLFSVAYRLLGRPADAEDIVQESWFRYARAAGEVREPRAWLIQVVTRLCLDQLRSARERHERPEGISLPEPVATGESAAEDPLATVKRRELLSMGALAMLRRLSPAERATLVLHEAIGLTHAEIATVLGASDAGSRQLLARARRRVAAEPARQPGPPPQVHRRLVSALRALFDDGDTATLMRLLREDAVLVADTSGELPAPPRPLVGAARILRFLAAIHERGLQGLQKVLDTHSLGAAEVEINGEPAVLFLADGAPLYLVTMVADVDGRLRLVLDVGGPTKLGYMTRQGLRLSS